MDIPYLRSEFLKHKQFLRSLFTNNPRRNSAKLEHAQSSELNTLIKILHLICNGKISLRKDDFKIIQKSKRLNLLKNCFETKRSFLNSLKISQKDKVLLLKKFSALYHSLLFTMFNLS